MHLLHALDPAKAAGIDGLGPMILKMAANILLPSMASLINKSIQGFIPVSSFDRKNISHT